MFSYKKPLCFIWNSFKGHHGILYLFFISKIIEGILYVVLPILAKIEMDQLVEKNEKLFGIIALDGYSIFLVILCIVFIVKLLENILQSIINLFQNHSLAICQNQFSYAPLQKITKDGTKSIPQRKKQAVFK